MVLVLVVNQTQLLQMNTPEIVEQDRVRFLMIFLFLFFQQNINKVNKFLLKDAKHH